MKHLMFVLVVLFSLPALAATKDNCSKFATAVANGAAPARLKRFLKVQWDYIMHEYPEWATFVGYPGLDDRWSDQSMAAMERRRRETRCQKTALARIPRASLSAADQVNYDLNMRDLLLSIESEKFGSDYMPINHLNGIQIDASQLFEAMPKSSIAQFDNILSRLEKLPQVLADTQSLMREGMKRHLMLVKAFMPKISTQLASLIPEDVQKSPLYLPFSQIPDSVPSAAAKKIRDRAVVVLKEKVYPAVQSFKKFFDSEYAPTGREDISWAQMPNGQEWYAYLVKYHTTTSRPAEELHALGLREVERITTRMNAIKNKVGFKGDLQKFNKFLLADKKFKFKSKDDLLTAYRDIAKRIDAELPKFFGTLPRLTYGVREIPSYQAKSAPAAHYIPGSIKAGRAGFFEANTEDLESRASWEMETLTMHEAVPGHHLQIALAQEMGDLPEFRKYGGYTAFVEGWALYAESLGEEMGFFKDPYALYGHLSDEMLRAVRLVVDTGMHSKGWTKDQALTYYRSKMPVSDSDSEIEIDRYITWPGQALAYKVGQLKIRELRDSSANELGSRFSVREFHDEVLKNGALPLEILEKNIVAWRSKVVRRKADGVKSTGPSFK